MPGRTDPDAEPGLPRHGGALGDAGLLLGPPVTVVAALHATGDLPVVFAAYHVAWCLVVPAALWALSPGPRVRLADAFALRWASTAGMAAGAALGLASLVGIAGGFALLGELLVDLARVAARLEAWAVPLDARWALVAYMVLVNSVAEELYWRGFLHDRLTAWSSRTGAIATTSVCFTSYHVFTIHALAGTALATALMTAGVLAGALAWAVLREATGSAVPPALAHVGATVGYMSILVL